MAQCTDCDAVKMFCDPPEGNGKCSACHGTGWGEFFDIAAAEFANAERPACEECYGSGRCQTCRGSGVIEEYEIRIAA
jgi:DnaJ-class molecular chaperone